MKINASPKQNVVELNIIIIKVCSFWKTGKSSLHEELKLLLVLEIHCTGVCIRYQMWRLKLVFSTLTLFSFWSERHQHQNKERGQGNNARFTHFSSPVGNSRSWAACKGQNKKVSSASCPPPVKRCKAVQIGRKCQEFKLHKVNGMLNPPQG